MRQRLSRLADGVLDRARGKQIRNITHTDTITTVYEEGRPAVVRTSASTNDPDRTLTPTARKPKRRRVRKNYKELCVNVSPSFFIMKKRKKQRRRNRKTWQRGGAVPLLAMAIPALTAIGKAAALGAAGLAAGHAVKKLMDRKPKRRRTV